MYPITKSSFVVTEDKSERVRLKCVDLRNANSYFIDANKKFCFSFLCAIGKIYI